MTPARSQGGELHETTRDDGRGPVNTCCSCAATIRRRCARCVRRAPGQRSGLNVPMAARYGFVRLARRAAMPATLVLLVAACSGSTLDASMSTSGSPPRLGISSQSSSASDGCTGGSVETVVTGFIEAFNTGNENSMQQLFSQAGQGFFWYSTDSPGQRFGPAADDRSSLTAYFMQRHAAHESLHLSSFKFNGNNTSMGDFEYTLTRTADDLPATPYVGKGSVRCTVKPHTIGTWSMARNPLKS